MRFELPDGLPFLWQYRPMESVCSRITSGGTPSRREEKYYGGDINWVKTQELLDRKIFDTDEKISLQGLNNSSAKLLPKDTVLLAMYGATVGKLGILGKESTCNQACCAFICDPKVTDYRFLYYCLLGNRSNLAGLATGAAQQNLSSQQLKAVEFAFPPLEYQKEIANLLSALDDRIDHNRALAANLEAIARRLFKSWFVDFNPVRAKAAGEKPSGLADDIAVLFPDRFVESELGEIPEGWRVETVGDLSDVVGGTTPRTKEPTYWDGGIHAWATPKDLSALLAPILLDTERQITDAGLSQISSGLLPKGTVLLSSRAPIGYLAIAEVPVSINQGFIAMKPKTGISNIFLLLWASVAREEIVSRANGSTFLEISKANFRPIPLIKPTAEVMQEFDQLARPLYEKVANCMRESRTLSQVRDLLLPRLISGKIRVSDAQAQIEESLA